MTCCDRHEPLYRKDFDELTDEEWDILVEDCPACHQILLEELGITEEEWVVRDFVSSVTIMQRLGSLGPWVLA